MLLWKKCQPIFLINCEVFAPVNQRPLSCSWQPMNPLSAERFAIDLGERLFVRWSIRSMFVNLTLFARRSLIAS